MQHLWIWMFVVSNSMALIDLAKASDFPERLPMIVQCLAYPGYETQKVLELVHPASIRRAYVDRVVNELLGLAVIWAHRSQTHIFEMFRLHALLGLYTENVGTHRPGCN